MERGFREGRCEIKGMAFRAEFSSRFDALDFGKRAPGRIGDDDAVRLVGLLGHQRLVDPVAILRP